MPHHLQSSELHCRPRVLQFCIGCYTRLCSFQNIAEASASCRMRFFLVCGGGTKFFPQRRKKTRTVILQMFPWGFLHPQDIPESMGTCVCTCTLRGRKRRRELGTELKIRLPVCCWQIFVSAHPHIIHRNDPGEDQRMGWISVSRGCLYHVVHVGISTRTPAPAALALATLTFNQFSNHKSP